MSVIFAAFFCQLKDVAVTFSMKLSDVQISNFVQLSSLQSLQSDAFYKIAKLKVFTKVMPKICIQLIRVAK